MQCIRTSIPADTAAHELPAHFGAAVAPRAQSSTRGSPADGVADALHLVALRGKPAHAQTLERMAKRRHVGRRKVRREGLAVAPTLAQPEARRLRDVAPEGV